MILKCKMCGGDIELAEDKTLATCECCGNTMTLPKINNDQRASLFNRGNHFRRNGEFDKALGVYENILREDDSDAEAHWCCALCRFGIEYVEDPSTYEWIPTCHRASFDSILEDVDYLAALEYSDGVTKKQYQKEAIRIADVQKSILATSQNEEPFDVFICYKESDENGDRTVDSTLAQDIYYQLTDAGFRVFFSRITLEDKAGSEYEPYIFAALNSAKVMIVVGTKPEYYNAVWVKNEWGRYLAMMRKDRTKLLLPCYRDMDPYEMPEALSILQSYDMSKIGFIQDLIRGVRKVVQTETETDKVTATQRSEVEYAAINHTVAKIKRGNMALEDGDFSGADEYFERALDANPADAYAYLGKFLVRYQFSSLDDFENKVCRLEESKEFKRAEQFADIVLAKKLKSFRELNEIKIERMHLIDVLKKISQKKIEEEPLRLMREAEKLRQQEMIQRAAYDEACARVKSRISYEDAPYIARLEEEFDAKIKDVQRKIEEEISINKGARDSFDDEISNLYNQKASLGLFKGKEKKAIQIKIDEIQNKMNQIESEPQVQNKYQNQLNQINREKRAEVNKITADIGSKYTMPKFEDFADCTRN